MDEEARRWKRRCPVDSQEFRRPREIGIQLKLNRNNKMYVMFAVRIEKKKDELSLPIKFSEISESGQIKLVALSHALFGGN